MDARRTLLELDIVNITRKMDIPARLNDEDEDGRMKKSVTQDEIWEGGRVPYVFDPFLSE